MVKLAYQIKDFARSGHQSADLVKPPTDETINHITSHLPRPIELVPVTQASSSRDDRARSRSLEPTLYYPSDWSIDKSAFKKAVAAFVKATRRLTELLSPSADTLSATAAADTLSATAAGLSSNPAVRTPRSSSISSVTTTSTTANAAATAATAQQGSSSSAEPGSSKSPAPTSATSAEEAIYQDPIGPEPEENMVDSNNNSYQDTGFSQQQWNALERLISRIPAVQGQQGEQGPVGPEGPTGPQAESSSSNNGNNERWNPADLGYFDPHLDKSYGEGEIVTVGKDIYYRSVILFIERVRDLATIKTDTLVRTNLNTSLRGAALKWYTAELSNLERTGLRNDPNGVEEWCKALLVRFRETPGVALSHLTTEKYTLADARARREPADYVQAIVRHAKSANIEPILNQLTFAHQGIAAELRVFVDPPSPSTTIAGFIQALELKKDAWFELNSKQQGSHQRQQPQQQQRQPFRSFSQPNQGQQYRQQPQQYGQQPYGQQQQSFPYRPYGNSYDRNAYRPQQFGYQNPRYDRPQQQQRELPSSRRPPLQITGPPSTSGSSSTIGNRPPQPNPGPSQGPRRFGNQGYGNRQPWQQNYRPKAAAYQATAEEENTQPEDQQQEQHDEQSHEAYQGSEDRYQEDTNYEHDQQPDEQQYDEQPEESFAGFVGIEASCDNCNAKFKSKSKLHKHLRQDCLIRGPQKATKDLVIIRSRKPSPSKPSAKNLTPQATLSDQALEVIDSQATDRTGIGTGLAFRGWNYAHILVRFLLDAIDQEVCIDTGCGVTLADKPWLLALLPEIEVKTMSKPLRVKGLGTATHDTNEYVLIPMYLPATKPDGTKVLCRIVREIHLVSNLKAHMLIGNDIVGPEQIVIDVSTSKATIGSCGATADISCRQRSQQYTRRAVHTKKALSIAAGAERFIPVSEFDKLPPERDFLFEPIQQANITLYAHIVDSKLHSVLAKNESNHTVQIPRKHRLGTVSELDYENVFFTEHFNDTAESATPAKERLRKAPSTQKSTNWIKKAATIATVAAFSISATMNSLLPKTDGGISELGKRPSIEEIPMQALNLPTAPSLNPSANTLLAKETRLDNGVMVYGDAQATTALSDLVAEFPQVWKDEGFVNIPEDRWMKITLRDDWQHRLPATNKSSKVYPLGVRDQKIVDDTFDKMQQQGRLEYTTQATPFSYPVFVVWRTLPDGTRKGRAVVDIRGLNDLIVPDVYPVPLQGDVIARLLGCTHIAVMDAMSFFYQWRTHPSCRYMLTIVTHRGQESFNVPVMGCMNSIAYVQREIDTILRPVKDFASAYVDDIVTGAKSLQQHLHHLRRLFQIFTQYNISIAPTKTFLGYPNVNLLGRRVDSLGMATPEDKLKAISDICYPATLGDLEHYLGLTGYLRQYVHFYAQIARPLQDLKTRLLKDAPGKGNPRRAYSSKLRLPQATDKETQSFLTLQEALSKPSLLVHFDPARTLWIDLDASKEFGFGVMIFHVKDEAATTTSSGSKWPARTSMQPIMFLSRLLTTAESNYWPTELEIAGFVWTIKKVRHMVESSQKAVIIQTDHSAILDIMRQSSIVATSSTLRMNVRLVRASQFLRQFRLEVRHKPGKEHVVPDALSRLASANTTSSLSEDHSELDVLYACATQAIDIHDVQHGGYEFSSTQVQMSEIFRNRLAEGYRNDPRWSKIIKVLDNKDATEQAFNAGEVSSLPFVRGSDGIFHVDRFTGLKRLCIPEPLVKDIFDMAHSEGHPGFDRCYEIVSKSWYIHGLTRLLRSYIRHCPQCLVFQTRRHRPYGSLQPIQSPAVPFHTLTLDFILALPATAEGFDNALTVTDKFTKRITYIVGKVTWKAKDWAMALLDRLNIADWGLPKVLLTDRDPKFLADLWEAIFRRLGVELLYSTAYHPQTDGSSERTNQTAEIALRFYIHTLTKPTDWPKVLPRMQALLNNLTSATTSKTPNELAYGFKLNRPLDLAATADELATSTDKAKIARVEAADAISFAQMHQKFHYDRRHQPMYLRKGDEAFIRLHHGYQIPSATSKKLSQQYVGPFRILERVGKQAYKLDIPVHWRVHPVFSLAQLEPAPPGPDPFKRPMPEHPESVFVEGDTAEWKSYVVERLLNKRVRHTANGKEITEYLVKWQGYGPEFDTWYKIEHLDNCMDLVEEYEAEMHELSLLSQPPAPQQPTKPLLPPPQQGSRQQKASATPASKAIAVVVPQKPPASTVTLPQPASLTPARNATLPPPTMAKSGMSEATSLTHPKLSKPSTLSLPAPPRRSQRLLMQPDPC